MSNRGKAAILEAAAKAIAWELYAASGYGRTRARISAERFDGELRSALRRWNAIRRNLETPKGTLS
jgi:hypothetical protein